MTIEEFKNVAEAQTYSFPSFYGVQYEIYGFSVCETQYSKENPLYNGKKETTFFIENNGEKNQVSEEEFLSNLN